MRLFACDEQSDEYYCYFLLGDDKIVCSRSTITNPSLNTVSNFMGGMSDRLYINQTMYLDYRGDDRNIYLCVGGPDGGVFYERKTDLTIGDCKDLVNDICICIIDDNSYRL
jgi:hypothetical protein